MKVIIFKSIIFILIISNYLIAQRKDSWTTFTTQDGLASNDIYAILEDNEGALWFGTWGGGASRYKEGTWETFNEENSELANNCVVVISEDSEGALWFGTRFGGVSRYKEGTWETFDTANSRLADNYVRAIIEDSEGALWFGTWGGGASRYKEGTWETFDTANSGLADDYVIVILEDIEGALWFGTGGGGASRYKEGTWETFDTTNSGLADDYVVVILEDIEGALWFGTGGGGASRYKEKMWETFNTANSGLTSSAVQAILEDSEGALWFGTVHGGVSRYKEEMWETFNAANCSIADNDVVVILEDSEGALWFGTPEGVSRYKEGIWETFNEENSELANNCVVVISEDNEKALWFGTSFQGVNRYLKGMWKTFNTANSGLAYNNVFAIFEDSEGALWFGTYRGVSRYNDGTWETFNTANSGLASNSVHAILEDSEGALWFGFGTCDIGVSRYKDGTWETFNTVNSGLASNSVQAILEDSEGALWFGHCDGPGGIYDGGASRYKEGKWEIFNTANSGLADDCVEVILEDSEGALWFGTFRGGLSKYVERNWEIINTGNSGLASNWIHAIIEDSEGALWFGTDGGASRYKEEMLETFNTANSGFASNSVRAILEDSKGALWFGTYCSGLSRLEADRIPPSVVITKSPGRITGSSTPFFAFRGKDYRTEESKILYSYAVVSSTTIPNETDFSFFFNETFIELSPLQNGTYTFYIRARDKMINISKPVTYTFTVDITFPTLIINLPTQEQHIRGEFAIIGSAFDNSPIKDFDYYQLYYGNYISETQEPEWKNDEFSNLKNFEVRNDTIGMFHTNNLEDGSYELKLWAIDTLKHESEDKVLVILDNTKPHVKITSPEAGDRVSKRVNIQATINDINIERYYLEYKMVHQARWQYLHQDTLNHSIENQLIYTWENSSDSGDVYLKLTAWDKAGNSTSDTVKFVLDNEKSLLPTVNIISPLNHAYLHDFVRIKGYATDKNFIKYSIFLKSENIDTLLIESDKKKENEVLFTFDTKTFPDDQYKIYLTVLNDKQYQKIDSVSITMDNTLPLAKITSPLSDTISCYALIQGEAYDNNLKGLTLKYAKVEETDSSKFILIGVCTIFR